MSAPEQFAQYPEIRNLPDVPEIFACPEVIITEKIHGSHMRIGLIDGVVHVGGRRLEFTDIRPDTKDGLGFVSWVLHTGLDEKVRTACAGHNIIFHGEWHGSGTPAKGWPQVQKGIRYFAGNDFRIFDVRLEGTFVPFTEIEPWAAKLGLGTMPVLYRGAPSQETFDGLIDHVSELGRLHGFTDPENTMEGMVIRPPTTQWNPGHERVMAKYKLGKWAERASEQKHRNRMPKQPRPEVPATAKAFAEEFVTDTRLMHVLDQLREANIPIGTPALGEVLKRMGQDIKHEGVRALLDAGLEWKDVSPLVTTKTKALFQKYLRESAQSA